MPINQVLNNNRLIAVGTIDKSVQNAEKSNGFTNFKNVLTDAIKDLNAVQNQSEELTSAFAAGKYDNMQQVLITAEKADVSLQFTMQVRNKIMDAYNEIMRMQV